MAVASLKSRIAKLEAKRNIAPAEICIVGGQYLELIVDPNRPGHLIQQEPPGGFAEWCRKQQDRLQAQIVELLADMGNEAEEQPAPVGIAANRKPDGFVFEHNGVDFVVVEGEAQPVRNRRKNHASR
ncbi:hypothetical protein [Sinirhodobacter huangdaonensis]|uniref:Uncharacterized protein n=1 Tax=Paenirhodobacter huangdaonensis TaxID=2501515 RepID=A0A443LXR8_9RHOB|nr:hypothetical protein [Sinirhodobacter huangdaonensis]RWR54030.1 hypothetical protein EOW66_05305 [Sinirhodobacter huangdaonensis]